MRELSHLKNPRKKQQQYIMFFFCLKRDWARWQIFCSRIDFYFILSYIETSLLSTTFPPSYLAYFSQSSSSFPCHKMNWKKQKKAKEKKKLNINVILSKKWTGWKESNVTEHKMLLLISQFNFFVFNYSSKR